MNNSTLFSRKSRWFVLMLAVAVLSSCNWLIKETVRGSGIILDEIRQLSAFHSISMGISADLFFTVEFAQSFRIVGDDNILQVVETTVKPDGTLEILSPKNFRPTTRVKIFVSMTEVRAFSLSGDGTLLGQFPFAASDLILIVSGSGSMEMNVTVGQITSSISGSGSIRLSGNTAVHTINISGSGSLSALDLDTVRSDIRISGSGECYVFVQQFLDADISGSGNVNYKGSPTITSNISGSGQLIKLD
ncbi:MAG: DUF2807 domain-containing protein [Candidatus Aminicenantes bacterium]|nr:DUF2807 domain-containing protein [Candidatus Aminicenantes bacterium]